MPNSRDTSGRNGTNRRLNYQTESIKKKNAGNHEHNEEFSTLRGIPPIVSIERRN